MARKKAPSTKVSVVPETTQSKYLLVLQTFISLVALSSTIFVTEKVLAPIFGEVATNLYLKHLISSLIIALTAVRLDFLDPWRDVALGTQLCVVPPALHWLATLTSKIGSPVLGPILAYVPVFLPIMYSATEPLRKLFAAQNLLTVKAFGGIALSMFALRSQVLWSYIPYSRVFSPPILLWTIGWISIVIGHCTQRSSAPGSRKRVQISGRSFILPLLSTFLALSQPPLLYHRLPFLHPNGLLSILSSTPSVTGRIVVGEDHKHGFRFLRADHSLLGGVWVDDKYLVKMDENGEFARDKNGQRLGDSIYSAFVLQEAVRLQERETPHKNALIIGLGIGVAAESFIHHGLETTIVEIDPAVYAAAHDFFGVPEPSAVYIEDARRWAHRQASLINGTYDIVVHDVFSGGGVPAHLFTLEFWEDLKKILSPDGIVAVNYAGVIGSESSKAMLLTLAQAFEQCRVFHDYRTDVPEDKLVSEFNNLVYFCTQSSKPLTFRPATQDDALSSFLRDNILHSLPTREVPRELILRDTHEKEKGKYILTDEHNPLGEWQNKGALQHWKVMRSLLPDYVWNTY